MAKPAFHSLHIDDLVKWVRDNNRDLFDLSELPSLSDDDTDEELQAAREEYESVAEEIYDHIKL
jgi:hypothetical protein